MNMNETTTPETDDGRTIEGSIKEVKEPDNALVVLDPPRFASELFKPFNDELAAAKRKRTRYDITTKEGMATAKEVLAGLVKIRTGADKAKSKAKKPIDQAGKEILAQYNALELAVKAEEKKHADVITEETARLARIEEEKRQLERARIEAIENRIDDIRLIPSTLVKSDAATIETKLTELVARVLDKGDFEEHLEQAITAQNISINELRQLLTDAREREARDAELARLRAEDEQRKATAAAAEKIQADAAARLKAQQDQMNAIVEIQGLASALTAAGQAGDREAVEAAVTKARAFNPDSFGAMAPMAALARDAALPLLEDLLANLPALEPEPEPALVVHAVPATSENPPGIARPLEQARATGGTFLGGGGRVIPKSKKPTDLDILELVAGHYGVPNLTAVDWLATFDAVGVRAALGGA